MPGSKVTQRSSRVNQMSICFNKFALKTNKQTKITRTKKAKWLLSHRCSSTIKKTNFVCLFVCLSGYAFRNASTYQAETWQEGRGGAPEVCGQLFEGVPPKVKGQPEVKSPRIALRPPDLVRRSPDRNVKHCRSQRSYRGHPGSTRGHFA